MRYLDTGSRDPDQALGAWLEASSGDSSVVGLRWQAGFFGADALGYFVNVLSRLASTDGVLHVVVGSNDGTTRRGDLEILLDLAGPPRDKLRIGVVAFDNAYFHPKTFHFTRSDGSESAYVGSANLTRSGAASLHVEAGIILDTRDGDDTGTLAQIRDAVDWWFTTYPDGLTRVSGAADLDDLVARGLLDVPRPPLVRSGSTRARGSSGSGARLGPLRTIPMLPSSAAVESARATGQPPADSAETYAAAGSRQLAAGRGPSVAAHWTKRLSRSDAQRKPQGNQRGSVALVKAGYPINAQTYFREDFFGDADWTADTTSTGEGRETAMVEFATSVLGRDLGVLNIPITYAPNREASQRNYTTLLHLGPLAPYFAQDDLTGYDLLVERRADGSFAVAIS